MRISGLPRNADTTYQTTRRHIPKTAVKPYFFIRNSLITKYLEEGLKGKLRMYLEKISLDLEEKKELEMRLG
jgi:hypothetical protein